MSFQWPKEPLTSENSRKAQRQVILEQIFKAKSGHPGGSLSMVEMISSLFESAFQHDVQVQEAPDRDRIVLSKGHGVPALYAAYSAMGFIEAKELGHLREYGHFLQGHPDRLRFPLMEASTGSLGQGVSVALGLALGLRHSFERGSIKRLPRVYCLLGDGEAQEGQVWECLMACGKFQPGNLCFVLDYNKGQLDGHTEEIMSLDPMADKARAFKLDVTEVDGHDVKALKEYFCAWQPKAVAPTKFLVAHTLKGKGISYMEGNPGWHGKAPSEQEMQTAMNELYLEGALPYGSVL